MSAEEPITAEQVTQLAAIRQTEVAERIATYANHRADGMRPTDARREVRVSDVTGSKYERWTHAIRAALELPPIPTYRPTASPNAERMVAARQRSEHSRWHAARGVTKPGCRYCTDTNLDQPKGAEQ